MTPEQQSSPESRDVMNIDQAAEFLGLSKSYLYRLSGAGEIPCAKIGTRTLFRRAALLEWVAAQEKR